MERVRVSLFRHSILGNDVFFYNLLLGQFPYFRRTARIERGLSVWKLTIKCKPMALAYCTYVADHVGVASDRTIHCAVSAVGVRYV